MRLIVEVGDSQKIGNSGLVQFRHAPWLQVDTQLCERGRILEVERGKRERERGGRETGINGATLHVERQRKDTEDTQHYDRKEKPTEIHTNHMERMTSMYLLPLTSLSTLPFTLPTSTYLSPRHGKERLSGASME